MPGKTDSTIAAEESKDNVTFPIFRQLRLRRDALIRIEQAIQSDPHLYDVLWPVAQYVMDLSEAARKAADKINKT